MPKSTRNKGFTLIEVLVAFTILAMTLGAVFAALSIGLTAESRATRVARATLLTRSALAELGVALPLEAGTFEEEFENGDFYRVTILKIEPFAEQKLSENTTAAYEVTVEAGAGGRVATELRTVKLGPAE